jgi:hypothetical protein
MRGTFAPGSFGDGQIGALEVTRLLTPACNRCGSYRAAMSRPGRNRPVDAPAINPLYLSEESDRRGLRVARTLFATLALWQQTLRGLRHARQQGLR